MKHKKNRRMKFEPAAMYSHLFCKKKKRKEKKKWKYCEKCLVTNHIHEYVQRTVNEWGTLHFHKPRFSHRDRLETSDGIDYNSIDSLKTEDLNKRMTHQSFETAQSNKIRELKTGNDLLRSHFHSNQAERVNILTF